MMHKQEWVQRRIMSEQELVRHVNIWHSFGKKIVFTNGCFDILHRGHFDILSKAADLGDILVVGLNTDASVKRLKGPERPVNHEQDRALQIASLLYVDAVCLFDEDTPRALIEKVKPDVLVKGGDYNVSNIVGADFVMSYGGRVEIIPFVTGYSTSNIISHIKKL